MATSPLRDKATTQVGITPEERGSLDSKTRSPLSLGLDKGLREMSLAGRYSGALDQEAGGNLERFREEKAMADTMARHAQSLQPSVETTDQINSLGDIARYVGYQGAKGAASMAPAIAGAVVGRNIGGIAGKAGAGLGSYAGATATSYDLEKGGAAMEHYNDPTLSKLSAEERLDAARTRGAVSAALEGIVPAALGRGRTGIIRNAVEEGVTEAAQDVAGQVVDKTYDPTRSIDLGQTKEAFFAGAAGGGFATGAMKGLNTAGEGVGAGAKAAGDFIAERAANAQQAANEYQEALARNKAARQAAEEGEPTQVPSTSEGEAADAPVDPFAVGADKSPAAVAERAKKERADETPQQAFERIFGYNLKSLAEKDAQPADMADLAGDTPEQTEANVRDFEQGRTDRVQQYIDAMLADPDVSEQEKQEYRALLEEIGDPETDQLVARRTAAYMAGRDLRSNVDKFIETAGATAAQAWETATPEIKKAFDGVAEHSREAAYIGFADKFLKHAPDLKVAAADAAGRIKGTAEEVAQRAQQYAAQIIANPDVPQHIRKLADKARAGGEQALGLLAKYYQQYVGGQDDVGAKRSLFKLDEGVRSELTSAMMTGLKPDAARQARVVERLSELGSMLGGLMHRTAGGEITTKDLNALAQLPGILEMYEDPQAPLAAIAAVTGASVDQFNAVLEGTMRARRDMHEPGSMLRLAIRPDVSAQLTDAMVEQVAGYIDQFAVHEGRGKSSAVLKALDHVFGSREATMAVLEYYQKKERDTVSSLDEDGMDEVGAEIGVQEGYAEYDKTVGGGHIAFQNALKRRPFQIGNEMDGKKLDKTAERLRERYPDTPIERVGYGTHLSTQSEDMMLELKRIAEDIKHRRDGHLKAVDKEKSEEFKDARRRMAGSLDKTLKQMREAYKADGPRAALDMFEVLRAVKDEADDQVATDADLHAMSRLLNAKDGERTKVEFRKTDGEVLKLSAESMRLAWGKKDGVEVSGTGTERQRQLFMSALAAVLNRHDVQEVISDLRTVMLGRDEGARPAQKTYDYDKYVAAYEIRTGKQYSIGAEPLGFKQSDYITAAFREHLEQEGVSPEAVEFRNELIDTQKRAMKAKLREAEAAHEQKKLKGGASAVAQLREAIRQFDREVEAVRAEEFEAMFEAKEVGDTAEMAEQAEAAERDRPRHYEEDVGTAVGAIRAPGSVPSGRPRVETKSVKAEPKKMKEAPKREARTQPDQPTAKPQRAEAVSRPAEAAPAGSGQSPAGDRQQGVPVSAADQTKAVLERFQKEDDFRALVKVTQGDGYFSLRIKRNNREVMIGASGEVVALAETAAPALTGKTVDAALGMALADELDAANRFIFSNSQRTAGAIKAIRALADGDTPIGAAVKFFLKHRPGGLHGDISKHEAVSTMGGLYYAFGTDLAQASPELFKFAHDMFNYQRKQMGLEPRKSGLVGEKPAEQPVAPEPAKARQMNLNLDTGRITVDPQESYRTVGKALGHLIEQFHDHGDTEAEAQIRRVLTAEWANEMKRKAKIPYRELSAMQRLAQEALTGPKSDARRARATPKPDARTANAPRTPELIEAMKKDIVAEIMRTRGQHVTVEFASALQLGASGLHEDHSFRAQTESVIRIAIDAADPMATAHHEAFHDFMLQVRRTMKGLGLSKITDDLQTYEEKQEANRMHATAAVRMYKQLTDLAEDARVVDQLRTLLKDEPAALKQMEADPEERLAYAYMFWRQGLLELRPGKNKPFQRLLAFMRRLIGFVTASEASEVYFELLRAGEFKQHLTEQRSVLGAAVRRHEAATGQAMGRYIGWAHQLATRHPALAALKYLDEVVFKSASDRLRNMDLESMDKLADLMDYRHDGKREGVETQPWLPRRAQQTAQWMNKLEKLLADIPPSIEAELLEDLRSMKPAVTEPAKKIRAFLEEFHKYMTDSGVMVPRMVKKIGQSDMVKEYGPIGWVENYFPRMWDPQKIRDNQKKFAGMLAAHGVEPQAIDEIIYNLSRPENHLNEGKLQSYPGITPAAPQMNPRVFDFINASNVKEWNKFQADNLAGILGSYIQASVSRATYSQVFGGRGEVYTRLVDEAIRQGVSIGEFRRTAAPAIRAMQGTLGWNAHPNLRAFSSATVTVQNILLLPFALITNLSDAMAIAVRSGEFRDAVDALKTGVTGVFKNWADPKYRHEREDMARMLGLIDADITSEAMGMAYAGRFYGEQLTRVNDGFFKAIGLTPWNRMMRVSAMVAAERFLRKQRDVLLAGNAAEVDPNVLSKWATDRIADLTYSTNSKTFQREVGDARAALEELGLDAGDILDNPDGTMATTEDDFLNFHQMTPAQARLAAERVQAAVGQWVDGAVLRPNAAHRPVWGSDPRFAIFWHLKQFAYSFSAVIHKRVAAENRRGNQAPALMLLTMLPFAVGTGVIRAMLNGTIDDNGLATAVSGALNRSGITGAEEIRAGFVEDIIRDGFNGRVDLDNPLLGTTASQVQNLVDAGLTGNWEQIISSTNAYGKAARDWGR